MAFFRRTKNEGATAVAEPPAPAPRPPEDPAPLLEELDALMLESRKSRDADREERIVKLRHRAGVGLAATPREDLSYPEPATDQLPERNGSDLPEFTPADL